MADWKMEQPELGKTLLEGADLTEAADMGLCSGEDVHGMRFTQDSLVRLNGGILEFAGCAFDHCTTSEWSLRRVSFVDCTFDQCELSNLTFQNAALRRVKFTGCRMTGVAFADAALMDTAFDCCMMDYLAVGESKLDRVRLKDCRMRESVWTNVTLKRVAFDNDDLTQTEWSHTPLKGMDMTTCKLDGIRIDLFDLRGLKVTEMQVIALSGLLGVEVVRSGW